MESDQQNFSEDISNALKVLKSGGLILYPTDTIWGIGCDATNSKAIDAIYNLKRRAESKSLIILISDTEMLKKYVRNIPPITHDLLERFKRPLTIIYPDAINLPKNLIPSTRTIAIRVVKHPFCVELIRQFNKPIVSTSANISGHASPSHFYEIDQEIKDGVGYIARYCRDNLSNTSPSTIIRLHTNGDFETIRD